MGDVKVVNRFMILVHERILQASKPVKQLKLYTVNPALGGHSKRRPKIDFQDRLRLNAGQKYCRMLQESILQYFRPSLSYHLS